VIDYPKRFLILGKVAFVTGGLGLIGREVSRALASAGGRTIILDIDKERAEAEIDAILEWGYEAHFEYFDITDLDNIDAHVKQLKEKYGAIDIWVNSAYPRTADWGREVEGLTLDSWRKNVDMHLNGYSWVSRRVALLMKDQGGGSIINIGSTYGVVGNDFTVYEGTEMTAPMAYAAIKGGIVNLTRYLAAYFGKYKVRVNTVCPGGIFNHQNPIFVKNFESRTPLKRMGEPDEIASAVLFLASESASYVTGATLMVDGGWTAI
jgi:NAD(P)-dependent dehydrogenase (short-subunit alcohol dehydrogenase family)